MEEAMQTFLNRVDQLRGRQPMVRFAKECDIKPSTMRNYLEGNTPPTLPALISIAKAKGVTVGWLAGDQEAGSTGQSIVGAAGAIMAGGFVSQTGSNINTSPAESPLSDLEQQLIDRLREVGSPVMIKKILQQLQELEDFVLGK
jgi:transcriptional regulator with XRE-family HTH domain